MQVGKIGVASEIFAHISQMFLNNVPRKTIIEGLKLCIELVKTLDKEERTDKIQEVVPNKEVKIVKETKIKKPKKRGEDNGKTNRKRKTRTKPDYRYFT